MLEPTVSGGFQHSLFVPIHITAVGSVQNNEGEWDTRFHEWRTSEGRTRALRSDSAASFILRDLPSTPVLTSTSVRRIHDVSAQAASTALEELCSAGILRRSRRQRIVLYQCDDVLDLVASPWPNVASPAHGSTHE